MSNDWEFYFSNFNDKPASIFVRIGLRNIVPDVTRPWRLLIRVKLQAASDDGLPQESEFDTLGLIEESLSSTLGAILGAELVGRISYSGVRDFIFHGPQPERFEESLAEAMANFPGYLFHGKADQDDQWSVYLDVLYPTPEEWQTIRNRHIVDTLRDHGDPLNEPRLIEHWIYFCDGATRSQFIDRAKSLGFDLAETINRSDPDAEAPAGVVLKRVDSADWVSINDTTLTLFRLANEYRGHYDGWESPVRC